MNKENYKLGEILSIKGILLTGIQYSIRLLQELELVSNHEVWSWVAEGFYYLALPFLIIGFFKMAIEKGYHWYFSVLGGIFLVGPMIITFLPQRTKSAGDNN